MLEVLAVAALVDGELNGPRIDRVLDFAGALGSDSHWLGDLALSKDDDLARSSPTWVTEPAERHRRTVGLAQSTTSTTGSCPMTATGPMPDWPTATGRWPNCPPGRSGTSSGRSTTGTIRLPGQPGAVNEMFATPHDCTHLLSGYDTTPQGELLVLTFTARMHPVFPMEGHISRSSTRGISVSSSTSSPAVTAAPWTRPNFWVAWQRGAATGADTFGLGFDFWAWAEEPLDNLRADAGVPPLEAAHAATSDAVAGVDYRPIP